MPAFASMSRQRRSRAWREVLLGLMLLLPLAQLGAIRHALSHPPHALDGIDAVSQDKEGHGSEPSDAHACTNCVAQAHLGTLALLDPPVPSLLDGLAFGLATATLPPMQCAGVSVPRNRGPPALG